jgi:hypothetical protein
MIPRTLTTYDCDQDALEAALVQSASTDYWIVDEDTALVIRAAAKQRGVVLPRDNSQRASVLGRYPVHHMRCPGGWAELRPWRIPNSTQVGGHTVSYIDGTVPFPVKLVRSDDHRVAVFPSADLAAFASLLHDSDLAPRGPQLRSGLGWGVPL